MLTVLVATARAAHCFTHHPEWDQFEVLGQQLAKQTYRDFELVVVSPFAPEAGRTLVRYVDRLTVVEPRSTPWQRARLFAAASARNTGLMHARGAWVLVVDDCCEFEPDFLERVIYYADRGFGVAVMYKRDGQIIDPRWATFNQIAKGAEWIVIGEGGTVPYGFVSFPIDRAVAINGYDELRFDGARGLEDMNFARRLMHHGLKFVMDQRIMATLHDHLGYPEEVIDNENQTARCCNTAHALSQMGPANRTRYTAEEKQKILNCMFWRADGKCGFHRFRHDCAYPKWAASGHPIARRILENDEEELFDLAAARQAVL